MRKILPVLACLVFYSVSAQKNFKNGWVVLNNGDTLKGQINYRQWNANPTQIEFKANKTVTYTVNDLKAFTVSGEDNYQKFTIQYHYLLPVIESVTIPEDDNQTKEATVWLRIIAPGNYSLGEYTTPDRSFFYVIRDGKPEELVYGTGIKSFVDDKHKNDPNYDKTGFWKNELYKDQLTRLLSTVNPSAALSTKNLSYSREDISAFFDKMNNNKSSIADRKSFKGSWGILLGVSYCSSTPNDDPNGQFHNGTATNNFFPTAGVDFTLLSQRNLSRFGITVGLTVDNVNSVIIAPDNGGVSYETHLNDYYASLSASAFYVMNPLDKAKWYIGAGVSGSLLVSKNNYVLVKNTIIANTQKRDGQPDVNGFVAAPFISSGIKINRLNFFARYILSTQITNTVYSILKTSRLQAGCIISISK